MLLAITQCGIIHFLRGVISTNITIVAKQFAIAFDQIKL